MAIEFKLNKEGREGIEMGQNIENVAGLEVLGK